MNQDLLHKYFKGETSVDEEKRILNWVDESEENRKTLQKERMLFDIALFTDSKRKMREKAGAGARIIPMLRWSARIAAAVIVAVSCGFLINEYQYDKLAQLQTVTVPAGQRAQITLADGTKVWLNSESTLSYRSDFGCSEIFAAVCRTIRSYSERFAPFICSFMPQRLIPATMRPFTS